MSYQMLSLDVGWEVSLYFPAHFYVFVVQHDTLFLTDPDESCAGLSFIPTSCEPYDGHD